MLQDMQEIQTKLNDGQQRLKQLSDKYMAAVNQTPKPEELSTEAPATEPIPMAVESFVTSLGISLTEDQRPAPWPLEAPKHGRRGPNQAQEN